MKRDLAVIGVLVLILIAGGVWFKSTNTTVDNVGPFVPIDIPGQKLSESKSFGGVVITPISVIEDSRCAEGVQCVWAGRVMVRTEIKSGLGTSFESMEINKPVTTEAETVTLIDVSPYPKEGQGINSGDYRFIYKVEKRQTASPTPPVTASCYVGGCSGQICSDNPGMVSTCEYREVYACYKTAKCERQPSGQCGWTPTDALRMCVRDSNNSQEIF